MNEEQTVIRRPKTSDTTERNAFVIVLSGRSVGKMFKLPNGPVTIGRSLEADIRLEDEGVSRLHLRLDRSDEGPVELVDLDSTNGSYVNGDRVHRQQLEDGDRIQLGSVTILKFSYQDSLEEQFQQQLYESATRDPLTQSYNKRFFDEQLGKDFSHAQRHELTLSLLSLDVDHFKRVNDEHGHPAGDHVLQRLAACIMGSLRTEDAFCRVGGEEFAVIARDCPMSEALQLAERVRKLVAGTKFVYDGVTLPVTISIGVSSYEPDKHPTANAMVEEADRALYAAKHGGRNLVASEAGVHAPTPDA
ncbi:MAG TPA: GGDEF domain-containing protein [Nannocystaceae bacterium]|nr:GGDEF domain-containing protein [Nannocystaceae bacterium]